MDYKPYPYSKEVAEWRVPTEEMPAEYMDPKFRIEKYPRLVLSLADAIAKDAEIGKDLDVHQEKEPARQLFEYILKLIPPQDLFEFMEHTPPAPLKVLITAAREYDPDCCDQAIALLQKESVPDVELGEIVQMLANS